MSESDRSSLTSSNLKERWILRFGADAVARWEAEARARLDPIWNMTTEEMETVGHSFDEAIEQIQAAKNHPDPELRDQWSIVERYDMFPDEILVFGLKDPRRKLRGRPKGSTYVEIDRRLAQEEHCRVAAGEDPDKVKEDILLRMPGGGGRDAKMKRRHNARVKLGLA